MPTVHNERIKLSAAFLNGVAIGVFVIGTFTPVVQIAREPAIDGTAGLTLALGGICIVAAAGLHSAARAILGRLRE